MPTIGGPARSAVAAAVLLAVCVPANAVAAPNSGSAGTGSVDSGAADTDRVDPNNYGADCPDILIVAVSGATDSTADRNPLADENQQIWGNWVANVTVPAGERSKDEPGTVGWMYVPYSSTYGVDLVEPVPTYQDSIAEGVAATNRILDDSKTNCGDATRYVLVGYSVGAEVAGRVARDIGHRDNDALGDGGRHRRE